MPKKKRNAWHKMYGGKWSTSKERQRKQDYEREQERPVTD